MMLRLTLLTLVLLVLGLTGSQRVFAQSPSTAELMEVANQLYELARYDEAVEAYSRLASEGVRSSAVYYNLGNAYFKNGDVGRAILYYRRAAALAPGDDDVKANLDFARATRTDDLAPAARSTFDGLGRWLLGWISQNQIAGVAFGIWAALLALVAVSRQGRTARLRMIARYGLAVAAALVVLSVVGLIASRSAGDAQDHAVVVADQVSLRSGPGDHYIVELALHSGAEVRVLETRQGWLRVALPGGEVQGWAPEGAVEPVSVSG